MKWVVIKLCGLARNVAQILHPSRKKTEGDVSNENTMQATYVIFNFLAAKFKKKKHIKVTLRIYLMQFTISKILLFNM